MDRTPSGTPFVSRVRVRFADTDAEGVVYYGSYLTYFEVARVELLRSLGFPVAEVRGRGVAFPVVAAECRYHRPAFVDEALDVCLWLDDCRRSSFGFVYQVCRGPDLLVSGYTRHACIELGAGRAIRRPDWFADLWERAGARQLRGGPASDAEAGAGTAGGQTGDVERADAEPDVETAGGETGPPGTSHNPGRRSGEHVVIWRYQVGGQARAEFEQVYGPDGRWARFFATADGYKKTQLLKDGAADGAYVVIDQWESAAHRLRFLERRREDYERHCRETQDLYTTEERLGEYDEPAGVRQGRPL